MNKPEQKNPVKHFFCIFFLLTVAEFNTIINALKSLIKKVEHLTEAATPKKR